MPGQTDLRIAAAEIQEFLENEADLLDSGRFEEWLALFADDATYWVPAAPDQESPLRHVSLFYDDLPTLRVRVARLNHPELHCQDPRSRTVRVISGFRIGKPERGETGIRATSKFVMIEDRPGAERRLFGGRYTHILRATPEGLRIVLKRIDLTNCDDFFPSLTQPF